MGCSPLFFSYIMIKSITNIIIPEPERTTFVDKLFGISYALRLEPTVFSLAERLASQYSGGYWQFYSISNGGFYMAPQMNINFSVSCKNGFEGALSTDALGIVSCLYAYSHLSFGDGAFAGMCADQYHLLREYMFEHTEAKSILRAID